MIWEVLGGWGLGIGMGFLAGFFTGSWSLRHIGFAIRIRETAAASKQKKASIGLGTTDADVGSEHPNGAPPAPPSLSPRDPRNWAEGASNRFVDRLPSKQAGR